MSKYRIKPMALVLAATIGTGIVGVQAGALDQIHSTESQRTVAAQDSQKRIDGVSDQTTSLLQKYQTELKLIDDLKVYNAKLDIQIAHQEKNLVSLNKSIHEVTEIQRRILPLADRMLEGLEEFVALDMPFLRDERDRRLNQVRGNLDRSDLTVAEKFRQVLEAYKIENQYGRKVESYLDSVTVNGSERDVEILRVGRIALLYQTTDQEITGAWDADRRQWVELDSGDYRSSVRQGLRMAKKQASIDIMELPISAPEVAK